MREIKINKELNHIHLLSGGLDSSYNLLKIIRELKPTESVTIHPIFFDYGHAAADAEWERIEKIVNYIRQFLNGNSQIDDPLKISLKSELFRWCNSDSFWGEKGTEKKAEIENRNMVLFSVLASYLFACAKNQKISFTNFEVTSGFIENELSDCNSKFFKKITELLCMYKGEYPIKFEPLPEIDRQQIIDETKELLENGEELKKFLGLTLSCYSPTETGQRCGKCSKCTHISLNKRALRRFDKLF